ncbi:hypothetical protein F5J12DRAFT_784819 [Pisolithus orientalis]|uniref:uncharacterized protein n=1 Tax=Pisolithus orientalis TaxID=936130 RepID=UPI002224E89A|nr:uncharacterized protein F5J12DRAFT_784819 [Pisolithus orientalis]KAI5998977.1 hypothetical protein F5J12DRAFT_784819 [Pisolithus orientalis]
MSLHWLPHLASIADSFIYVILHMEMTGSSIKGFVNTHFHTPYSGFWSCYIVPFDTVVEAGTDGVFIRSPIVSLIKELPAGQVPQFDGRYVLEALFNCLIELEEAHNATWNDPMFWADFKSHYGYMNHPSKLYSILQKIWLKQEDLNHTGSHKINNAVGQLNASAKLALLQQQVPDNMDGVHHLYGFQGCAETSSKCFPYEDAWCQGTQLEMSCLSRLVQRHGGMPVNKVMRDWVTNLATTHSSSDPVWPSSIPNYQKVIGHEIKAEMKEATGKLLDVIVACIGGGSNAIGSFMSSSWIHLCTLWVLRPSEKAHAPG